MKNLLRAVPLAFLLGAFLGALEGICLLFFVDLQFRQPALEMFGMEWRHGLLGVVALPVALLVAIVLRLPRKTPADLAGWSFLGISWLILNMWIHTEVYRHASVFRGQPLLILLGSIAAVFILHWVFRRVTAKTTKHAIIVICAGVIFLPVKAQFGYTRATPPPTAQVSADLPDITVVVIDTLRADHLGLYGYSRKDGEQTSPFMDSFAAESLVFENCWSQAPWTRPSMASLHSGLFCTPAIPSAPSACFKKKSRASCLTGLGGGPKRSCTPASTDSICSGLRTRSNSLRTAMRASSSGT